MDCVADSGSSVIGTRLDDVILPDEGPMLKRSREKEVFLPMNHSEDDFHIRTGFSDSGGIT